MHTQFLQKQLEQPLKVDSSNISMQHAQQNQPQIQQFQMVQKQSLNVSDGFLTLEIKLMSNCIKII